MRIQATIIISIEVKWRVIKLPVDIGRTVDAEDKTAAMHISMLIISQ